MFGSYYKDLRPFNDIFHVKDSISYREFKSSKSYPEVFISKKVFKKKEFAMSKNLNNPDYKFISRNFWQKFIDQYWKETIYLSLSSPESETSVNELISNGLSIYNGNKYKHFLTEFNKALINGNILVSLNNASNSYSKLFHNQMYFKYIWYKQLYLSFSYIQNIQHILTVSRDLSSQRKKMVYNSLPLFNLVNNSRYIVMAESGEQELLNKNSLNMYYSHYMNLIRNGYNYNKKIYTGLFFINAEDANEYKEYIHSKYLLSSRNQQVKLFISPLSFYYNLINLSASNIDFRLMPDLKELSRLIYHYQYYKNIFFHKEQKYGKNYFKGQPIYFIQPILAKHKFSKEKKFFKYDYSKHQLNKVKQYNAGFLNYDTAILAWIKFKEKYNHYIFPKYPSLEVYNLEDCLDLYILNKNTNSVTKTQKNDLILVPSLETYMFIKKNSKLKEKYMFKEVLMNQVVFMKQLTKRIIWSLTSRQPIN